MIFEVVMRQTYKPSQKPANFFEIFFRKIKGSQPYTPLVKIYIILKTPQVFLIYLIT